MSEISREEYDLEEYKEQLKNHDYWCRFSWQDDICIQALKDREKLEKIEKIVDFVRDNENILFDDDIAENLFKIEQIVKE